MDIIITIPDQHIGRVSAAVRASLPDFDPETGDPVEYTNAQLLAEFKRLLREFVKDRVQQHELLEQQKAVAESYVPLDPTSN